MKIITVTITDAGDQLFIKGHGTDVFCELGETQVQRGSHIVPEYIPLRLAFKALRAIVSDTSWLAAWSRTWACWWMVDASPVGGQVLPQRWLTREHAIAAEIEYLNKFFLGEN